MKGDQPAVVMRKRSSRAKEVQRARQQHHNFLKRLISSTQHVQSTDTDVLARPGLLFGRVQVWAL